VIAVDRATGALRWIKQVDSHPAAVITGSPVVFEGVVYVGVSSTEEGFAASPTYQCCTFRGSVVALNSKNGAILWQAFTVPDNDGKSDEYSGGAVWQPPAIDPKRGTLFIGTGNNYNVPASVAACQNKNPKKSCSASDDFYDTALALDLKTGQIKWANKLEGFDTWTLACVGAKGPNPNCPVPNSPDFDLGGAGPNLIGNIVGFGQKSGIYWALNPDTGKILWASPVGPGGNLGGVEWGTATDGERIYIAIANYLSLRYILVPSGQQITWGAWTALDIKTGRILWQTADPTTGSIDRGSVSVANGVMYAGSNSGADVCVGRRNRKDPLELRQWRHRTRRTVDSRRRSLLGIRLQESRWDRQQQGLRFHAGELEGKLWADFVETRSETQNLRDGSR
jgi:polyvinyl alcohol dehydrogenase (cytochrome)